MSNIKKLLSRARTQKNLNEPFIVDCNNQQLTPEERKDLKEKI